MANTKGKHYKEFLKLQKKLADYWDKACHNTRRGQKYQKLYTELYNKMWNTGKYHSFLINYGKSYPRHKGRTKKRDDIQKFKNGQIEFISIDKIPREYEY